MMARVACSQDGYMGEGSVITEARLPIKWIAARIDTHLRGDSAAIQAVTIPPTTAQQASAINVTAAKLGGNASEPAGA